MHQFVNSFPLRHRQETTIRHWQLRDLLSCPHHKDELFFVQNYKIMQFTPSKSAAVPLVTLSFVPTSLKVRQNLVIAGGYSAELSVYDLDKKELVFDSLVGSSINNGLDISVHGGEGNDNNSNASGGGGGGQGKLRLSIASNDNCIRVFDLPTMSHVTNINCIAPINNAVVSPNGRKMVAVGDRNEVYLYDINNNASAYSRINVLQESKDGGFSCAWNNNSTHFAVCFQDGIACVWDVRSSKVMAKFNSSINPINNTSNNNYTNPYSLASRNSLLQQQEAFRSIKFSQSTAVDLLVIGEHTSSFHVIDARNYKDEQIVKVGSRESNISGIAFDPESKSIFVGMDDLISEYDVNMLQRRTFACSETT